jgi:hypothetical protein
VGKPPQKLNYKPNAWDFSIVLHTFKDIQYLCFKKNEDLLQISNPVEVIEHLLKGNHYCYKCLHFANKSM